MPFPVVCCTCAVGAREHIEKIGTRQTQNVYKTMAKDQQLVSSNGTPAIVSSTAKSVIRNAPIFAYRHSIALVLGRNIMGLIQCSLNCDVRGVQGFGSVPAAAAKECSNRAITLTDLATSA